MILASSPKLLFTNGLGRNCKLWWAEIHEGLVPGRKKVCAGRSGGLDWWRHWESLGTGGWRDRRCAVALGRLPGRDSEVGWWIRKPRWGILLATGSWGWQRSSGPSQHFLLISFPVPGGCCLESLGVLLHPVQLVSNGLNSSRPGGRLGGGLPRAADKDPWKREDLGSVVGLAGFGLRLGLQGSGLADGLSCPPASALATASSSLGVGAVETWRGSFWSGGLPSWRWVGRRPESDSLCPVAAGGSLGS